MYITSHFQYTHTHKHTYIHNTHEKKKHKEWKSTTKKANSRLKSIHSILKNPPIRCIHAPIPCHAIPYIALQLYYPIVSYPNLWYSIPYTPSPIPSISILNNPLFHPSLPSLIFTIPSSSSSLKQPYSTIPIPIYNHPSNTLPSPSLPSTSIPTSYHIQQKKPNTHIYANELAIKKKEKKRKKQKVFYEIWIKKRNAMQCNHTTQEP